MLSLTIVIPAGATSLEKTPGLVLSVKTTTLPITAALDNGASQPINGGTVLDQRSSGGFNHVTFINNNAVAVTVTCFIGDVPVLFQPGDNSQRTASTYSVGSGAQSVAAGGTYTINSGNNGHQRKTVIISTSATSLMVVEDASGNQGFYITANTPLALETDAVFIVKNFDSVPHYVYVLEIYYLNQ